MLIADTIPGRIVVAPHGVKETYVKGVVGTGVADSHGAGHCHCSTIGITQPCLAEVIAVVKTSRLAVQTEHHGQPIPVDQVINVVCIITWGRPATRGTVIPVHDKADTVVDRLGNGIV